MSSDSNAFSLRKPFKRNNLFNVLRVIIVAMILCTTAFPAFTRADSKTIVVNLWIGNSVMSVNGLRQPIDPQGTKPIIVESRTLVPIRAIIETFGGNVAWEDATKKVTINFNNNILELRIGQSTASLNGYAVQIDSTNSKVVPMIINGRTMVPLRFVAESFGIDVQYEETSKMITLTYVSETTPIVQLPVAPMLASPTNNSTLNNSNITFTWTAVSGVDLYKLQIIKDGLTLNSFESITTNSYTLTGTTLADGTYSWQVAAHNSAGWSSWSAPSVFVISTPVVQLPAAPTLTSPASNSTFTDSNITFTWVAVTGVDYYKLQVIKDNIIINTADSITANTYSMLAGTLADGTYSWQVAAHNSAGWGPWSSSFVFSISTPQQLPEAPVLSLPATGSTLNNSEITLAWLPVTGADTYQVQVNKDSIVIHSATNITSTAYKIPSGTLSDGTYSWQVAAHNTAGWGSWSSPFVFSLRSQLTITDIAKFVDRVVFIEVSGIEDGQLFKVSGSGFIISSDGRIVTNYHVIDYATDGTVTLNNKTNYDIVSVLGYDKNLDLAVIKINTTGLPVCTLGDSSKIQIGESVVAIGSPLGYQNQNTVSSGIISRIQDDGTIQTTTPVSPGSSGGPLFNMYGEVIGAIFAKIINGENMNLAKPINNLQSVSTTLNFTLKQVYENEHGYLGTLSGVPSLISPANESVLTTLTPTLSWTPVSGADYYAVWIGTGRIADDQYKIWYQNVTTGTLVTMPTGILAIGKEYTWSVCAHNASGFGSWSEAWHFSIAKLVTLPGKPSLIAPANESVLTNTTPTLSWTPVSGADSYGVWVGIGRIFDDQYKIWSQVVTTGTSVTVPAGILALGKEYTWNVCAHNAAGWGSWSNAWHFSIAAPQLTAPVLLSPDDKESLTVWHLSFSWASVPGATSYIFWVGLGLSGDSSTEVYKKIVYGTSWTIPEGSLVEGEIYTWAVCAVDSNLNIAWSVDRHFSLIETYSPTPLYPTNYSTIYTNPTMMWFSMYGATSYKLILCEGATFSVSNIILSKVVYSTQYTLPAYTITHGKTYCWYVGAYSGDYIIGISDVYVFTVAP